MNEQPEMNYRSIAVRDFAEASAPITGLAASCQQEQCRQKQC